MVKLVKTIAMVADTAVAAWMYQMEISRCDAVLKIQRVFRGYTVRNGTVQVVLEVLDTELAKINHREYSNKDSGEQDDDGYTREKDEYKIKQFQQIEHQHKKSTNKTFTKADPEAQTISPNNENSTTTKHSPQPNSMFILVQSSENTDNIKPNDENGTTTKHSPQPPSMFILVQSSENTGNIMHSLCTIDDKEGT